MAWGVLLVIALAAVVMNGCKKTDSANANDTWTDQELEDAGHELEAKQQSDSYAVEGAHLVCSSMKESQSNANSFVVKSNQSVNVGGGAALTSSDISFEPFSRCRYSRDDEFGEGPCKPSIEHNSWQDCSETNVINGEPTVLLEQSFMFCTQGCGVLYLTDNGQRAKVREDNYALHIFVSELGFSKMDWNLETFRKNYGDDVIVQLKNHMQDAGIADPDSIKMFLATLGTESGKGRLRLEDVPDGYLNGKTYTKNTRGAGLIQLTGATQLTFLSYLLNNHSLTSAEQKQIQDMLNGKSGDGTPRNPTGNSYDVAGFIAANYPIESAVWFWMNHKSVELYDSRESDKKATDWITIDQFITTIKDTNPINSDDLDARKALFIKDDVSSDNNVNLDNLFVCTQLQVNGTPYFSYTLADFSSSSFDLKITQTCTHRQKMEHGEVYCLTWSANDNRHDNAPHGWTERERDWKALGTID